MLKYFLIAALFYLMIDVAYQPINLPQQFVAVSEFEFDHGATMKEARLQKGLSVQALANLAGLSQQNILDLENNLASPTRDVAIHLERILELKIYTRLFQPNP